jgi:hypothetical protein
MFCDFARLMVAPKPAYARSTLFVTSAPSRNERLSKDRAKRTFGALTKSAKCHKQTHAPQHGNEAYLTAFAPGGVGLGVTTHTVKAGVNYHFGGPVVARY